MKLDSLKTYRCLVELQIEFCHPIKEDEIYKIEFIDITTNKIIIKNDLEEKEYEIDLNIFEKCFDILN